MSLLDVLERIGELPAEVLLIPPVVILAGMAAISWLRRSIQLGRYRRIADHTGLTVASKFFNPSEVRGSFRGRQLVMTTTGRRQQTLFRKRWTQVAVELTNPESIGLNMWQQGGIDRFVLAVGGKEIIVGDPDFDRQFVIRSREDALVTKLFRDAELRRIILEARIESVELHGRLFVYYARVERDPAHAELLFTAVTRLADAIDALTTDYRPEIIRA